jgi:hypothetical protein
MSMTQETNSGQTAEEHNWGTYWAGLSWEEREFLYELWGLLYNTHLRSQLRPI